MKRIGFVLVALLVGAEGVAQARPMKCNTAATLAESEYCKKEPKRGACKEARARAAEPTCQEEVRFATVNVYRGDCERFCDFERCIQYRRTGAWAWLWNILWTPQQCEDNCDACNSDGTGDGAIHLDFPPKTGGLLPSSVDALAYSASPRGGVEPADPCQRAREAERIACNSGSSQRCKEAQREAREVCPPRGLCRAINVLVAIVGTALGEGDALAAPVEQVRCDAAVAGAIECDDNGRECSSQRAAVARRCKAPLIQQWLTSNFMTHFYPSREHMSVDEFIGWLAVDGTVRDCQNLVGPMTWASTLPAVFLGHAEVSVPWRNAGYALSQRIKNGPCAHRWRE